MGWLSPLDNDPARAAASFGVRQTMDPTSAEARNELGKADRARNRPDEAARWYRAARAALPRDQHLGEWRKCWLMDELRARSPSDAPGPRD